PIIDVHMLKGAAGTLGYGGIDSAAACLEVALKSPVREGTDELMRNLAKAFDRYHRSDDVWLGAGEHAAPTRGDRRSVDTA
ncbi:MAG: Hpt domain-containing protein, partial [Phreatobacter sp.]